MQQERAGQGALDNSDDYEDCQALTMNKRAREVWCEIKYALEEVKYMGVRRTTMYHRDPQIMSYPLLKKAYTLRSLPTRQRRTMSG